MSWADHSWVNNPFNQPPKQKIGFVPPPDPSTCPNPTGSTNVPGQTWGDQGNFSVFAFPSQPVGHALSNQGSAILFFVHGIPSVDMPRGNPLAQMLPPTCSDQSPGPCTDFQASAAPGTYIVGRSDYVAVLGAFHDLSVDSRMTDSFVKKYQSLWGYNAGGTLSNVPDGASNTLLFSEFCGLYISNNTIQPQLNGWWSASWTSNAVSVAFGTCPYRGNDLPLQESPKGFCNFDPQDAGLGSGVALGGWHPGRFNVAFADGSVRALPLGIDRDLLFSLAGYNDGDALSSYDF